MNTAYARPTAVAIVGTSSTQMTVLMSVRIAAGWVNVQTKLSRVQSPDESWNARMLVRIAG